MYAVLFERRLAESADELECADYINDGVYGAFNSIMFDHQVVQPHVLTVQDKFHVSDDQVAADVPWETCSLWGPTCVRRRFPALCGR